MFRKSLTGWFALHKPEMGTVLGAILLMLIFSITTHGLWVSGDNMKVVLRSTAQLGIITLGQAILIISGELDLSVGSVYGFSGAMFVILANFFGIVPSFFIVIILTMFIGFFNGFIVLKLRVPSIIATLGAMYVYRGLIYFITRGFGISLSNEIRNTSLVQLLGGIYFGSLNNLFIWFILGVIILTIILVYTRYGNAVFAVGDNALSALSRGVSPVKTKWIAFIICSVLSGFSAMATVSNVGTTYATLGEGMELQSIASVVVGGVSLGGGAGSLWAAAIGAFTLSTIRSGLIMVGAPPYWFITFIGIVLIVAVVVNRSLATEREY